VASHWGGTRNGTIIHWPGGFASRGEIRPQFHHVIDIAATILDVARIPEPSFVNGIQQLPLHGASMAYSFDAAAAPDRRETQYFEMFCNRGIYHKGWTAVTRHSTPWVMGGEMPAFDDDTWELYDTNTDWTQAHDLAKQMPDKLRELQRLWLIEAARYNVLPLNDRRIERFNSDLAGRPLLVTGNSQILFGGMGRLSENSVINLKNKSHSVTAEIVVPDDGAEGVIIAQGGAFAGWALYLLDGKPAYCHNLLSLARLKRQRRLHPRNQPVHRNHQLGPARRRRRQPRPPDHTRRPPQGRHDPAVNYFPSTARPIFREAQAQPTCRNSTEVPPISLLRLRSATLPRTTMPGETTARRSAPSTRKYSLSRKAPPPPPPPAAACTPMNPT
jgi:hypothetical protein